MSLRNFDNTLANRLSEINTRLQALENARQPYVADWRQLPQQEFTYNSASGVSAVLDVGFTPSTRFSIGDRLEITQTTIKYFVLWKIDDNNNQIHISGGDDYTLLSATIDKLRFSRSVLPPSFPEFFNYTPDVENTAGPPESPSVTNLNSSKFVLVGNRLRVYDGSFSGSFASNSLSVKFSLPFYNPGTDYQEGDFIPLWEGAPTGSYNKTLDRLALPQWVNYSDFPAVNQSSWTASYNYQVTL